MTDNEIIKALECCSDAKAGCSSCPLYSLKCACCVKILCNNALDLIKRQKEEIGKAKSEAVREFAEKLKEEMNNCARHSMGKNMYYAISFSLIDKLVEEME